MARKPTMRDVARLAGVSTMTVSRVLARSSPAAGDAHARVHEAIAQLGYVPDRIAGSLASQRSGFIGVILPTLQNFNFADTAQGLSNVLRPLGYQLLFGYTEYRIAEEETLVREMLGRRPEAMVLTGGRHSTATRKMLLAAQLPTVATWDLPQPPIDRAVGFSNVEIGRTMTRRLIERGYREILFVGASVVDGFCDFRGEDRLTGYLLAMREAGLREDLVIRHGKPPAAFAQGARAIGIALDRGLAFDAVLAVSDMPAVGAMTECRRRGLDVPRDVGIAGFGDFEFSSQLVPSITTVKVDAVGIGARAGQLIVEMLDRSADGAGDAAIDLGFEVIERESTARQVQETGVDGPRLNG